MKIGWWLGLVMAGLAGCAAVTYSPGEEPEFLVVRTGSPFWALGPQQAGPPDERLELGERVQVVRWEPGFSRVLLATGQTGYLANEDLKEAPPGAVPRSRAADEPVPRARGRSVAEVAPDRSEARPTPEPYRGPPVEVELPTPDLDEAPEDGPVIGE